VLIPIATAETKETEITGDASKVGIPGVLKVDGSPAFDAFAAQRDIERNLEQLGSGTADNNGVSGGLDMLANAFKLNNPAPEAADGGEAGTPDETPKVELPEVPKEDPITEGPLPKKQKSDAE
jgi:hypothetical protein